MIILLENGGDKFVEGYSRDGKLIVDGLLALDGLDDLDT